MSEGGTTSEDFPRLNLPAPSGHTMTSGSFEVPTATVRINLKPELAGRLLVLLGDAIDVGVDATWFRPKFENAASTLVETASGREYMQELVELAELARDHALLTSQDVDDVRFWASEVSTPTPVPAPVPAAMRKRWDEARGVLQTWLDSLEAGPRKKLLRQRSIARVTCVDCHSMLAWLVPQGDFEFLVLARGDTQDFEVAHAAGEYGGYARGRCARNRGGRLWVLHADYLRDWLNEGNADVSLRHTDKGA